MSTQKTELIRTSQSWVHAEKFRRDFQTFDIIGHLAQPDAGTVLVTPEGVEFPVKAQGWKDESEA